MFGKFVRELRLKREMGLREFCKKYRHDPSNWSKVEREILPPPEDQELLKEWASHLGLEVGSSDWYKFFDLASIEKGRVPNYIMEDKRLVEKLPLFFRTLTGHKPTRKEMEKIADFIKHE